MTGKAFMWTFVGFCLGLAVVELTNRSDYKNRLQRSSDN